MNGHRPAGDRRTHAERQGDALVELCRQALSGGSLPQVRGERPQVRVSVDLVALCAERGYAGLPFAGPITAETARRIACDASVVRILSGPGGLPMDIGREQRSAPAGIRRAIEARDVHCVFSGCGAPAAWCDVHHVIHWAFGGPTSCDNGALLCERHHTAVHEARFCIARDPGTAVWHTYRPPTEPRSRCAGTARDGRAGRPVTERSHLAGTVTRHRRRPPRPVRPESWTVGHLLTERGAR